jgi:hypothetical protein
MTQSVITSGDAVSGIILSSGNDGTLVLQSGPAGSKINAISVDATGKVTHAVKTPITNIAGYYNSGNQTIGVATLLTLPHGLGSIPSLIRCTLKCLVAENGFSVGDVIIAPLTSDGVNFGATVKFDATNIYVRYGSVGATTFATAHWTTGASTGLTNANWAFIVEAYA